MTDDEEGQGYPKLEILVDGCTYRLAPSYAYLVVNAVELDLMGQGARVGAMLAGVYDTAEDAEAARARCPYPTVILPGVPLGQDLWTHVGDRTVTP